MTHTPPDPGLDVSTDGHALERLYREHEPEMCKAAARICGDDDAGDAVRQVFSKLASKFFERVPPDKRRRYLIRAAKNEARRIVARGRRDVPLDEEPPLRDGPRPEPIGQTLGRRWLRRALADFVVGLPSPQGDVIRLRYREDLSREETAEQLGISVKAVEKRTTRAFRRLRKDLASRGLDCWGDVSSFLDGGGGRAVRGLSHQRVSPSTELAPCHPTE